MSIKHLWWRLRWVYYMRRSGFIKQRLNSLRYAWRESKSGVWVMYYDLDAHPNDAILDKYYPSTDHG